MPYGATYADLGIRILEFLENEPFKFGVLFFVMCISIGIGGGILFAVYRGVTALFKRDYFAEISKERNGGNEEG